LDGEKKKRSVIRGAGAGGETQEKSQEKGQGKETVRLVSSDRSGKEENGGVDARHPKHYVKQGGRGVFR